MIQEGGEQHQSYSLVGKRTYYAIIALCLEGKHLQRLFTI